MVRFRFGRERMYRYLLTIKLIIILLNSMIIKELRRSSGIIVDVQGTVYKFINLGIDIKLYVV